MAGTRKLASQLRFHDRGVTVATSIENWEIVPDPNRSGYGLQVDLGAGTVSNAGRRVPFASARVLLPMTGEKVDAAPGEVSGGRPNQNPPTVRADAPEPLSGLELEVLGRCAARHAEDYAADLAGVLRELNGRRVKSPQPD